jgi:hypothetical protein
MSKKLYTVDYTSESYPQIVCVSQAPGVTLLEAKDELYRWAAGRAEHFRMVARASIATRKEDVEAGSIYTTRATLDAKRARTREPRVAKALPARDDAFVDIGDLLAS